LGYGVVFVQHSSDEKPDLIFAQSLNAFCVIIRWTFMCIFISLFCNNCISHPLVKLMQGKEKIKNKTKSLVCSFLLNNFNAKTCFPLKKTTNKHKKRKIKIKFYGFFFANFLYIQELYCPMGCNAGNSRNHNASYNVSHLSKILPSQKS
jgi:hypothetical protein